MRSTLVTLHAVTLICNTPRSTAAGLGDVAAEGPLADAPVPHGALEDGLARAPRRVGAWRRHVAPVRLARHLAEVAAVDAVHLNANVVRACVVDAVSARALSGESGQCHARPAALLERCAVDVEFPRMRIVVVVCVHVEAATLRRGSQCEQDDGFHSHRALTLWVYAHDWAGQRWREVYDSRPTPQMCNRRNRLARRCCVQRASSQRDSLPAGIA